MALHEQTMHRDETLPPLIYRTDNSLVWTYTEMPCVGTQVSRYGLIGFGLSENDVSLLVKKWIRPYFDKKPTRFEQNTRIVFTNTDFFPSANGACWISLIPCDKKRVAKFVGKTPGPFLQIVCYDVAGVAMNLCETKKLVRLGSHKADYRIQFEYL